MKLLIIGLNNPEKLDTFCSVVSKKLNTECIVVPNIVELPAGKWNKYNRFTQAAFVLEDYIYANKDYWSSDKPFCNVLYVWGNYDAMNIEYLDVFLNTCERDLMVLSTDKLGVYTPNWVFGNIIAMIKWSGELFKIDPTRIEQRDLVDCDIKEAIWFSKRIGLNVKTISI